MANVGERDHASRLDRSNCILPPSNTDPTSSGRDTITVNVDLADQQSPAFALSEVSFPTILKACWILTLQCYIVADVVCFKYFGPLDLDGHEESQSKTPNAGKKSKSAQYYTRVDPAESIWSFLRRIESSHLNLNASVEGHGIGVADQQSSRHNCNTGVYLRESEADLNVANFEVSIRMPWVCTVAERLCH